MDVGGKIKYGRTIAAAALLIALTACTGETPEQLLASAKDYLKKDDYKSATIQLKNALQANSEMGEARFLLAKVFLNQRDGVSAELEFRKALAAKYSADAIVPQLARALLLQGKTKDLISEFGDTSLTTPTATAQLKTSLATAYASRGELASAQLAVNAALAAAPEDPGAILMQARLIAARGEYDQSLKAVDELLKKAPHDQEALQFKGELLLYAKNEPDAAFEAFKKAVELKPNEASAYSGLLTILLSREQLDEASKVLTQLRKVAPNLAETKYFEAQLAYQKKEYRQAKEAIQQLLKVGADNPRYLQLAGAIEFQTNSLVQAEFYLGKALQKSPSSGFARRMLIATYLRQGQGARAVAALPPSIEQESTDAELLSLAGQAYLQSGNVKKSEDFFARATKLDPTNAGKRTSLAVAQLRGGKSDLAMGQLRDIASSDSGTGADLELISVYLQRKEFDKALAAVDQLEKKQPQSPDPSHLRGIIYLTMKDPVTARSYFEKAMAVSPTFFPSAASLAGLDLAEKKPELAKGRFDAILKRDPKNVRAMLALAEIKMLTGGSVEEVAALLNSAVQANPSDLAPRRALIENYLRHKDYKAALSAAQSALSALPESPELLDALGRAQQGAGEANQAIATFNKLANLRPDSPQAQMRLAGMYLLEKNPSAAEQAWRQALRIQPDFLDAQRALIIFNLQGEKVEESLAIARTVQKQRPNEPVGWLLEGDIGVARKKWADAADAYRAGLKKFPTTEFALKLYSVLSAGEKQSDAASFAKSWLADHPKDTVFIAYLGNIALVKKDYPRAEKQYREVLELQPQNALALNNLAWLSVEQKKTGGVEAAEKANQISPNRPEFMDTLALALSLRGDHSKAVELQKKAIGLQPDNPYLALHLAQIYLKAGDKKNAGTELDRLAALGSKFPLQQQVEAMKGEL